jgi:lipoyl synthase
MTDFKCKPRWMKSPLPSGKTYYKTKQIIDENNLHTICTSGNCPNRAECWNAGTATFMILGEICTRSCKFCGTKSGKPLAVDKEEPLRLAKSIKLMQLKHAVVTSVDRDDLNDGGAAIWAESIRAIKKINLGMTLEVLIPDFDAKKDLIQQIIEEKPEVISHNLETVRRLTPLTRSKAKYETSLKVLKQIATSSARAKSGIMLGLGETKEEVVQCMQDMYEVGVEVLTLGQYLAPSDKHLAVKEWITPELFKEYEEKALEIGFKFVESGPLVRSSYHAEKHV